MTIQTPTQQQTVYSDFLSDFRINPLTKDLISVTNEQSVINSIKKILKTNNYEVPYAPYFGANIRHYLFENYTPITEAELKNEITFAIENFEPRANLIDVLINGYPDQNSLDISVTFSIINSITHITVSTTLTRVR